MCVCVCVRVCVNVCVCVCTDNVQKPKHEKIEQSQQESASVFTLYSHKSFKMNSEKITLETI